MNKIEKFLNKIYNPKVNPKKRKKLFKLSIFILIISLTIAGLQFYFERTKEGLYFLCTVFGIMSLTGIAVAKYGSDFWVALIYGEWSI
ncbi:hypothetical protein [Sulfurimonas sp. CS5]|jgi:hypothetical protein|uniref:hypothetical protein n=1 Tax=Sulfurimonas sp. CS5 TaxID=3391145 RepID=UPI0039EAFF8F